MTTLCRCYLLLFFGLTLHAQNSKKIETLEKNISKASTIDQKIDSYVSIFEYTLNNSPEIFKKYHDQLASLENNGCEKCKGVASCYMGNYHKQMNDYVSAIEAYKKGSKHAKKANDKETEARCYAYISERYLVLRNFEKAKYYAHKIIDENVKGTVSKNLLSAHFILGSIHNTMGFTDLSVKEYAITDSLADLLPIKISGFYKGAVNNNLAKLFREIKDYDKSQEYLIEAKKGFAKINDTFNVMSVNFHYGILQTDRGNYQEALDTIPTIQSYFKKNNFGYDEAVANLYLGISSNGVKKYKDALKYLKDAQALFSKVGDTLTMAETYYYAGESYMGLGDYRSAKVKLDSALYFANYMNVKPVQIAVLHNLSRYGQETENYKAAFTYEKIRDSLNNVFQEDLNKKNTQALEISFQTKKKEQEINLLTSNNQLIEERRKNERTLLLGGLLLLFIAGLFLFFQYRNRQKTNKKLQELDTVKSTFLANISHEFRTPLSLIKGPIVDQLELKTLPKNQRSNLLAAERNTNKLESLIEQLLALSKLESGTINLQVQPGNLSSFIAAQIEVFNYMFSEKKLETNIRLSAENTTDWFDSDLVEKVMSNLLGNAIKYTPEKGEIILIGERVKNSYKLSVKNSGVILSTEQQKNIFQRFYQTDPKNPGTGIGLALTKELIELHKGTIKVKSEENDYTEFIISIPITIDSYTEAEKLVEELQKPISENIIIQELDTETTITTDEDAPILLIVDDSQEIRDYVASIFEKEYLIFKARNGKEGFEIAKSEIPDIIISDVLMPTEDGFKLTKNIKEDPLTSHIPVILLTAKNKMADKLEAMGLGADAYITKPFSSKLVKATAANLIETRRKLQQRFAKEVILTPKELAVSSADEQFLERLQLIMDKHLTNPELTVDLFSNEMNVSRMQLHRKLKALTGYSTTEFLRTQRLKLAAQLLKGGKISVSEVGYTVGFNDISYFGKCFKKEFGCAPSNFATE